MNRPSDGRVLAAVQLADEAGGHRQRSSEGWRTGIASLGTTGHRTGTSPGRAGNKYRPEPPENRWLKLRPRGPKTGPR